MTDKERADFLFALLGKYAEHVRIAEGVSFLGDSHRPPTAWGGEDCWFSDQEWAVLQAADRGDVMPEVAP